MIRLHTLEQTKHGGPESMYTLSTHIYTKYNVIRVPTRRCNAFTRSTAQEMLVVSVEPGLTSSVVAQWDDIAQDVTRNQK